MKKKKKKKKNSTGIRIYVAVVIKKMVKYPIYASKECCEEKHVDLLLIGLEGKEHYILMKDVNAFMYDYPLHRGRKHFCCYCLQTFRTAETRRCHIKYCFEINGKKRIKMQKRVNTLKLKITKGK